MGGGGRRCIALIKYLALKQSSFTTFFQKLNKYCCFQISANLLALETWCTEALELLYHWKYIEITPDPNCGSKICKNCLCSTSVLPTL